MIGELEMTTEKHSSRWDNEYPAEKLKDMKYFLSSEIMEEHNVRNNTLNSACQHEIFPCLKAGRNWKIYDTPPFRAWLESHKYRAGRGQGPKPKNLEA